MTLIEAAKQARNMLEHIDLQDSDRDFLTTGECEELDRIITAINQAIAHTEQHLEMVEQQAEGAAWQGLTDEELYKVFPAIATYHEANKTLYRSIARVIEAKIKEKTHD